VTLSLAGGRRAAAPQLFLQRLGSRSRVAERRAQGERARSCGATAPSLAVVRAL
jgi:hypothetical protein